MAGSALLRQLQDRVAPVTLAAERLLIVPAALEPLFAQGGLPRGVSVAFRGSGSWSVALALAASALGDDGWMAVLGVEELGLVAAAELGLRLDRVLLVSSVASAQLGLVAATLMEAVDVLMLAPRAPVGARDARRLAARARERGTVLFHLDGGAHWPEPLDLTVTAGLGGWEGLGEGHGHLRQRHLEVAAVGRRAASLPRRVSLVMGGPDGPLLAAAPTVPAPLPATVPDPGGSGPHRRRGQRAGPGAERSAPLRLVDGGSPRAGAGVAGAGVGVAGAGAGAVSAAVETAVGAAPGAGSSRSGAGAGAGAVGAGVEAG